MNTITRVGVGLVGGGIMLISIANFAEIAFLPGFGLAVGLVLILISIGLIKIPI